MTLFNFLIYRLQSLLFSLSFNTFKKSAKNEKKIEVNFCLKSLDQINICELKISCVLSCLFNYDVIFNRVVYNFKHQKYSNKVNFKIKKSLSLILQHNYKSSISNLPTPMIHIPPFHISPPPLWTPLSNTAYCSQKNLAC